MSMDIDEGSQLKPRHAWPRDGVREDLDCSGDPGMTRQEFLEESNINTIVRKYGTEASLGEVPIFGDFSDVPDYQSALNQVLKAQTSFMSLPAELRARFDNDPARFLDFVQDPKNGDELIALGLRERPPKAPEPVEVIVKERPPAAAPTASGGGEPVKGGA